jgi:pyridoxamine 5'-phosphate oxidase
VLGYAAVSVARGYLLEQFLIGSVQLNVLKSRDFTTADDPFVLFEAWQEDARIGEPNDPTAMALSTVDPDGLPDVRMVLLKGMDRRGFVFYTNFESAKGRELQASMKAAALFHWKSLRRQIRIRGPVEVVTDAEADAYYGSRPRQSRIGAWASPQSRPLKDRAELEASFATFDAKHPGETIPRPPHWSGFRIKPLAIEFWSDGAHRLHDRILFSREAADGPWSKTRLAP